MSDADWWVNDHLPEIMIVCCFALIAALVVVMIFFSSPPDCAHVTVTGTTQGFTSGGQYVYGTTTMERDATPQERAACLARQKKG